MDRALAAELTRAVWESRRAEAIERLIGRKFSQKAATLCFNNFVETMAFVAAETGEPPLGARPVPPQDSGNRT